MALVKCVECGKDISDKVKACIHCGAPVTANIAIEKKEVPIETAAIKPKTSVSAKVVLMVAAVGFSAGGVGGLLSGWLSGRLASEKFLLSGQSSVVAESLMLVDENGKAYASIIKSPEGDAVMNLVSLSRGDKISVSTGEPTGVTIVDARGKNRVSLDCGRGGTSLFMWDKGGNDRFSVLAPESGEGTLLQTSDDRGKSVWTAPLR